MRKRLSQVEVGKTSVTSRGVDKETCFYEDYGIKKLVDTAQGTLSSLSHYCGSMVRELRYNSYYSIDNS
jgi:hypothetical protein